MTGATRPGSVTVVGWAFVVTGFSGLIRGALPLLETAGSDQLVGSRTRELTDASIVLASGAVAILGGVLVLRGSTWGRWLLAAWMAFHVVIGGLHSPFRTAVHGLLFAAALFILFGSRAAAYFTISSK